jgi:hypothetical protein
VELVFGEESEPTNAILLVFPQLSLDVYGNVIRLNLTAVQKLCQELSFVLSSLQQFFREAWRIWQAGLNENNQSR